MRSRTARSTSEPEEAPKQRPRLVHYAILTLGWGFIGLGILGIFLPILQGILFLAIGAAILSRESATFRRGIGWIRKRFPKFAAQMDAVQERAERAIAKVSARFKRS